MFEYQIRIPLIIEQKNNFEKYDLTFNNDIKTDYTGIHENITFDIKINDNEQYIELKQLKANDYPSCIDLATTIINRILPICSLLVQYSNSNQHYTHIRIGYSISNTLLINERALEDEGEKLIRIRESVGLKMTSEVDLSDLERLLNIFQTDIAYQFILDCYYRAIGATDHITKFYNAFTPIEFMETNYSKFINSSKVLSKSQVNLILELIRENKTINKNNEKRVIDFISGSLSKATIENRAQKLASIITDYFNIKEINFGVINYEINEDKMKRFIDIRNSLYHGKKITNEESKKIFQNTIELILLLQQILINWKSKANDIKHFT